MEVEEEDAGVCAGRGGYEVGVWPPMRESADGFAREEEQVITWGMLSRRVWHLGFESGSTREYLTMGIMVPPQLSHWQPRDKTKLSGITEGTS